MQSTLIVALYDLVVACRLSTFQMSSSFPFADSLSAAWAATEYQSYSWLSSLREVPPAAVPLPLTPPVPQALADSLTLAAEINQLKKEIVSLKQELFNAQETIKSQSMPPPVIEVMDIEHKYDQEEEQSVPQAQAQSQIRKRKQHLLLPLALRELQKFNEPGERETTTIIMNVKRQRRSRIIEFAVMHS